MVNQYDKSLVKGFNYDKHFKVELEKLVPKQLIEKREAELQSKDTKQLYNLNDEWFDENRLPKYFKSSDIEKQKARLKLIKQTTVDKVASIAVLGDSNFLQLDSGPKDAAPGSLNFKATLHSPIPSSALVSQQDISTNHDLEPSESREDASDLKAYVLQQEIDYGESLSTKVTNKRTKVKPQSENKQRIVKPKNSLEYRNRVYQAQQPLLNERLLRSALNNKSEAPHRIQSTYHSRDKSVSSHSHLQNHNNNRYLLKAGLKSFMTPSHSRATSTGKVKSYLWNTRPKEQGLF